MTKHVETKLLMNLKRKWVIISITVVAKAKYLYFNIEITCGTPPSDEWSTNQIVGLSYGDNATYECVFGYQHVDGDRVLYCAADGEWHGDPIQCQG